MENLKPLIYKYTEKICELKLVKGFAFSQIGIGTKIHIRLAEDSYGFALCGKQPAKPLGSGISSSGVVCKVCLARYLRLRGRLQVYISSSWKQRDVVKELSQKLEEVGCLVYDFTSNSNSTAPIPPEKFSEQFDPEEHDYATYLDRKEFWEKMAENRKAIKKCDLVLLLLPCGNDAHADWGLGVGLGKTTIVVGSPIKGDRSPVHLWADTILPSVEEAITWITHFKEVRAE